MKTRTAVFASIGWLVLVLALALGTLWNAWNEATPSERGQFESRAKTMGSAAATFVVIGWSIVWGTWAARRRQG